MKCIRKIIVLFLFLLAGGRSVAQDGTITASLSRNPVGLSEQVQITFTVDGNPRSFQPPSFSDFMVLGGPYQSSSVKIVNGNFSQSVSYSYVLQPKGEGTFKIGPAFAEVNGKKMQSNILSLEVRKDAGRSSSASGSDTETHQENLEEMLAANVFIRAEPNKTQVYHGEELIVTYKLYTRLSLVNFNLTKVPSLNGFWSQDIENPERIILRRETVNGIIYDVADLKKSVLFPQQSGTLTLDAMEGECVVRIQSQRKRNAQSIWDLFDDPFFGGSRYQDLKHTARSQPVKITVKELPSSGGVEGFKGTVGRISMETRVDKTEVKTNEAITLKVKVSGKGNLKLIEAPSFVFPPGMETYDPKISDNISVSASGISGSRTFEFLIIPRHAGEYRIDPVAFSYFDPEKKNYITLRTDELLLKVQRGAGDPAEPVSGISKEDVKLLGRDIRYIKTHSELEEKKEPLFGSPLYYTLLASPLLLLFAMAGYRRRIEKLSGDARLMKTRRASREARKRLSRARRILAQLASGDTKAKESFYEEIAHALWGYASDKLHIPLASLSKDTASEALKSNGVADELIREFMEVTGLAELARFAPAGSMEPPQTVFQKASGVIIKLEEKL